MEFEKLVSPSLKDLFIILAVSAAMLAIVLWASQALGRWQRFRQKLDLSTEGIARTEEIMEREFEEPPKNP